jgi:hypothetical protein
VTGNERKLSGVEPGLARPQAASKEYMITQAGLSVQRFMDKHDVVLVQWPLSYTALFVQLTGHFRYLEPTENTIPCLRLLRCSLSKLSTPSSDPLELQAKPDIQLDVSEILDSSTVCLP